jgi:hypothetical protein
MGHRRIHPTQIRKFIAQNDTRITSECDGHGAGFPHVGLRKVAESLGYGSIGSSYGNVNVYSETLKAWNGSPEVIGWIVDVRGNDNG